MGGENSEHGQMDRSEEIGDLIPREREMTDEEATVFLAALFSDSIEGNIRRVGKTD